MTTRTQTLFLLAALIGSLGLIPNGSWAGAGWVGTDDFFSGISTNWTVNQQRQGQMLAVGTNQHLSFIVGATTSNEQDASLFWNGTPVVSDDWTVDITAHNSASWWSSTSGASQLQLWVVNSANHAIQYRIAMAGGETQTDPSGYEFNTTTNSADGFRQSVAATNSSFGLRLIHQGGVAGDIEAWYDPTGSGVAWTVLDTMSMAAFWPGVAATNTFAFVIVCNTDYGPITEGQMWVNYFSLTNSPLPFPITTNNGIASQAGIFAAFSATNYLVGIQGDGMSSNSITAQMFSTNGNLTGSRIATGRKGEIAFVAYGGTNFLLVWSDNALVAGGGNDQIYGQFISRSGALVGSPFTFGPASEEQDMQGGGGNLLAFDGKNYLAVWETGGFHFATSGDVHAALFSQTGSLVVPVIHLTSGAIEATSPAVVFGKTNYLAVTIQVVLT